MLKKAANRTQVNCHQTRSKFDHQRDHFDIDSAHKKSQRTVDVRKNAFLLNRLPRKGRVRVSFKMPASVVEFQVI